MRPLTDHQQSRARPSLPNRLPQRDGIEHAFVLMHPPQQHRVEFLGPIDRQGNPIEINAVTRGEGLAGLETQMGFQSIEIPGDQFRAAKNGIGLPVQPTRCRPFGLKMHPVEEPCRLALIGQNVMNLHRQSSLASARQSAGGPDFIDELGTSQNHIVLHRQPGEVGGEHPPGKGGEVSPRLPQITIRIEEIVAADELRAGIEALEHRPSGSGHEEIHPMPRVDPVLHHAGEIGLHPGYRPGIQR